MFVECTSVSSAPDSERNSQESQFQAGIAYLGVGSSDEVQQRTVAVAYRMDRVLGLYRQPSQPAALSWFNMTCTRVPWDC